MKVTISELRRATEVLFDHLERSGHSEIDIDADFYWSIPDESLYTVSKEPAEFTVGQLSDDLKEVRAIGLGAKDPISYALVWLGAILRYVGSKVVS